MGRGTRPAASKASRATTSSATSRMGRTARARTKVRRRSARVAAARTRAATGASRGSSAATRSVGACRMVAACMAMVRRRCRKRWTAPAQAPCRTSCAAARPTVAARSASWTISAGCSTPLLERPPPSPPSSPLRSATGGLRFSSVEAISASCHLHCWSVPVFCAPARLPAAGRSVSVLHRIGKPSVSGLAQDGRAPIGCARRSSGRSRA